jgi:ElaB/YqjD/DUF883 family membrane-anchored ribosome-binding protein
MNAGTTINGNESVAPSIKRTAASEVQNLVADVEDLLKKVTNTSDADIARLRARVQDRVVSVKSSLAAGSQRLTETARIAASTTDDFVRRSPWQAVGIAALAGTVVGYLLSRR